MQLICSPIKRQHQLFWCVSELALLSQEQAPISISTIHRHPTLVYPWADASPLRLEATIFAVAQIVSGDEPHLAVRFHITATGRVIKHEL